MVLHHLSATENICSGRPSAEFLAQRDKLAEVIAVVVDGEEYFAQQDRSAQPAMAARSELEVASRDYRRKPFTTESTELEGA